jgi:glycine/D-amino acid oxidase-like deaminating enzyme
MGSVSLWQAELAAQELSWLVGEPLRGEQSADVAIVGAGITGTVAALWLARAGAKVIVLEGREVAAGASGRNGGFLANGTTESYATTIARHGREKARRIWDFTLRNHELAAQLIAELASGGWDCGYRRNGSLQLAIRPAEGLALREDEKLLREDGYAVESVGMRELPPRLSYTYRAASYYPANGEVHPARYVAGMSLLATRAGATIYPQSPVVSLAENEQGVELRTPLGRVRAGQVLLATNAWLPEIARQLKLDWLAACLKQTRGQMLATEPLAELVFPCPCSADEGYQYWRQVEGRLVVGGWRNQSLQTENTDDETPGWEIQQHLEAFLHETLNLPGVRIVQRWAGIMAFSRDALPLVGRVPGTRHFLLAGGYTGHGNAYAVHAAHLLSELIQGKQPEETDLFDPTRFVQ